MMLVMVGLLILCQVFQGDGSSRRRERRSFFILNRYHRLINPATIAGNNNQQLTQDLFEEKSDDLFEEKSDDLLEAKSYEDESHGLWSLTSEYIGSLFDSVIGVDSEDDDKLEEKIIDD